MENMRKKKGNLIRWRGKKLYFVAQLFMEPKRKKRERKAFKVNKDGKSPGFFYYGILLNIYINYTKKKIYISSNIHKQIEIDRFSNSDYPSFTYY